MSENSDFGELKSMGVRDSIIDNNLKEFQLQKGKVTSTYIMEANIKNDNLCDTFNTNVTLDVDTFNTLDKNADLIYKIIKHQLKQESHPIRMIIDKFSQ